MAPAAIFPMNNNLLSRSSHWHRLRWQLFWGLIAAALPMLARLLVYGWAGQGLKASVNAFWGGVIATFLGILLVRNVGRYPGVERASAIIPGFSLTFGILGLTFLMLRLDYSRWILGGAYLLSIAIFYTGYAHVFGRKRLTIGVLPIEQDEDNSRGLREIPGISWVTLSTTHDIPNLEAVAADLRRDMPVEWERRLADIALSGIPVYHDKHLIESLTGRVELEHLSETSFGTLSPPSAYLVPKYVFDRLTAAVALVVLLLFFMIIGVLVRLDSPGPAIFRQRRIGFRGKPFTVYKFRTMLDRPHGESARTDAITQDNDSRITRLGRMLRRSRIDELPQIINILKGEMSWIGPRPEAEVLSTWYEAEIPFYRYRHIVRPGITGWAQVTQGHVAEVQEVQSKLFYDFYYIKNFSLWMDMLIVVRTLGTVISGVGAK